MQNNKRALTGIRPTGNIHLGNYLGAIRPGLAFQKQYKCLYFVADMHSMTTNKDPKLLKSHTYDIIAVWLALGLDPDNHILFKQSDIPIVTELTWYLSCCTGVGTLEKAHAYKDAKANAKEVNHGTFTYPVLMAADILLYDSDIVPVGKDQKQHVEMARDMAGSFNALYGENVIKLPEPKLDEKVMLIPGLDGRKMSKSYKNEIPLFCSEKELRKTIMSIATDSSALEDSKSMNDTALGGLFKLFATEEMYNDLESRLSKGGLGWGHAKQELFEVINDNIRDSREKYTELIQDKAYLDEVLKKGKERALAIAEPVIQRIRKAIGF